MGLLPDSSRSSIRLTFGVEDLPRDGLRAIFVASPYGLIARSGWGASG
jgi:hypothetical protein